MIVLKRDYSFGSFIDPFTTLSRKQPAKLPLWCAVFTKRPFTKPTEPLRIGKEFAKAQSGRWMEVCDLSTLYLFFVFVFVCFCFKVDIWWFMILHLEDVVFQHFHIYFLYFVSFVSSNSEVLPESNFRLPKLGWHQLNWWHKVYRCPGGTTAETASHLLNFDVVRILFTPKYLQQKFIEIHMDVVLLQSNSG